MIQRRQIIKTAAAVAVSAPFISTNAQQSFTLKFQTFVPASSNIWMRVITPWMKKVETESGGRIKFEG
ncbi:MAG: C4-dicarboxylate ABC transporter, partial [Betaproteobacteria bacterium]